MCQLLGMNCNVPTDICFSFTGFQARGGATDVHTDGWGIAFFEGKGARLFLDHQPSCQSPVAALVRGYPIRSTNVVAHIRKATQGAVGQTDSERAFCWLLQELRQRFAAEPPAAELFDALHALTLAIARHGEFNFLLSNGSRLYAHCSTQLAYVVRKAPFAAAHLKDQDVTVDFSEVTTPNDRVAVIATVPLTDNEQWSIMPPGSLSSFEDGQAVAERMTVPGPVKNTG